MVLVLAEVLAGATDVLTRLCSLNGHPVPTQNPPCSRRSGHCISVSGWPRVPPWSVGSLGAGPSLHLLWVGDLHVPAWTRPSCAHLCGVCLSHPTLCQRLAQSWTQEMVVGRMMNERLHRENAVRNSSVHVFIHHPLTLNLLRGKLWDTEMSGT